MASSMSAGSSDEHEQEHRDRGCCRQNASSAAGRRGWSRRSTMTKSAAADVCWDRARGRAPSRRTTREPPPAKQLFDLPVARPDQRDALIHYAPISRVLLDRGSRLRRTGPAARPRGRRPFQLRPDAGALKEPLRRDRQRRHLVGVERPHELRRDEHHQLGLFLSVGLALEQVADDRDAAQDRDLRCRLPATCCAAGRRSQTTGRHAARHRFLRAA